MASLVNHANAKKKGKKEKAYLIKAEYCSIETKAFSIYSLILFKSNVDKKNSINFVIIIQIAYLFTMNIPA